LMSATAKVNLDRLYHLRSWI